MQGLAQASRILRNAMEFSSQWIRAVMDVGVGETQLPLTGKGEKRDRGINL